MHVKKVHNDDLDDGYYGVSGNEILNKQYCNYTKKRYANNKTNMSYKPSGRSLLLLDPVGRVSGLDIASSGLMFDLEDSFCFFAGDGPGSGFALHLLAAGSLCLFGT